MFHRVVKVAEDEAMLQEQNHIFIHEITIGWMILSLEVDIFEV